VLCLDTLGYVTAGNSRPARVYQNSVGTYHCHLQSRFDETKYMETCILFCKGGKAVPLQAWTGPEGGWRCSSTVS
jgi:hypothetical protein